MHAAVVSSWDSPPEYKTVNAPIPNDAQVLVQVIASGVHQIVRSRAAGKHYSVAHRDPPHIPGVDGVGYVVAPSSGSSSNDADSTTANRQLVYFNALKSPTGSLTEQTIVDKHAVYPLPATADPVTVAAIANPALSAWMALTTRAGIKPAGSEQQQPFSVAVLGATGVSGKAAVQVAKSMGATTVIAIGRDPRKVDETKALGADATIIMDSSSVDKTDFSAAADVDIGLDYLWGESAATALEAILAKRTEKFQRLTWVQIGSVAGDVNPLSSALLRSNNVAVLGCGHGSWNFRELHQQLPDMLKAIVESGMRTAVDVRELADVEKVWTEESEKRLVFEP